MNIDNQNDKAKRDKSISVVNSFFELMHKKDIEAWSRLWNENAVILVLYPPQAASEHEIDYLSFVKKLLLLLR